MVRPGVALRNLVMCGLALTTLGFAKTNKTIVTYPTFGVSQPVIDMPVEYRMFPFVEMPEPRPNPNHVQQLGPYQIEDPVLQKEQLPGLDVTIGLNFDGIASNGYAPSDSNMAVGPNHIVETVNVEYQVFNKSGGTVAGPTSITNIFAGLAGDCSSGTFGDPVVLYDRAADRWLISMIGSGATTSECIAVSKTNDPTGAFYLYGYSFGANLNDYPKLGTWATASNSAYLATYDIFINFSSFGGSDLCGLDRTKMLAGNASAAQLCQMTSSSEFSYLPSDMDGPTPPVDGTPGLFIHPQKTNQLYLRTLTLNFANGTATMSQPTIITVPSFSEACHSSCVPQSGTTQRLDGLGDLTMYRFAVRHFADHDRAVVNDSVIASGSQIGVRWYELYDPAGAVTLNQSGTYAPDSSTYRWMASAAEDKVGDIAIGYSASSSSIHPANRFAGRVPTDPLGSLEGEISIIEGGGSESSGLSRWGDYSALQVDPSDDCTFWYVAQYEAVSGTFNWHTRIASWSFPGCSGGGGGPAVSLNPTSLKFGKVLVGQTVGKKKVVLTNTGDGDLHISTIATTGDFALVPVKQTKKVTPCVNSSVVHAGGTCEIKVSFTPTQTGTRTGAVNFTDDASDSPQSVAITGTGK
ncbi:MAG TPA: choice-of-anchor D domain-containing protein [Terriglobales bacterium]|nr:choice-of-anchor D domain-containing protein [Terriglobales bacterium]